MIRSFNEMHLSAPMLDAIARAGYTSPTPIQARAIGIALEGKDLIGCAQTGTGKTAAFAIPIIERLCRSEEHTSELQSRSDLVCRLLLEKKNSHRIAKPQTVNAYRLLSPGTLDEISRELQQSTAPTIADVLRAAGFARSLSIADLWSLSCIIDANVIVSFSGWLAVRTAGKPRTVRLP